jgi:hypothetical protein
VLAQLGRRTTLAVAGLVGVVVLTSASWLGFSRQWKEATARKDPVRDRLEGRWEGEWRSREEDEPGPLRAVIKKLEEGTYEATFRAEFFSIFSFDSAVILKVEDVSAEVWRFSGETDLGWFAGGVFRHEGRSDGTHYTSKFVSRHFNGIFRMRCLAVGASSHEAGADSEEGAEGGAR